MPKTKPSRIMNDVDDPRKIPEHLDIAGEEGLPIEIFNKGELRLLTSYGSKRQAKNITLPTALVERIEKHVKFRRGSHGSSLITLAVRVLLAIATGEGEEAVAEDLWKCLHNPGAAVASITTIQTKLQELAKTKRKKR